MTNPHGPLRGLWRATGRWQVRRYLQPPNGRFAAPVWMWAVIGPVGEHVGSSPVWFEAMAAADDLARNPELRWR